MKPSELKRLAQKRVYGPKDHNLEDGPKDKYGGKPINRPGESTRPASQRKYVNYEKGTWKDGAGRVTGRSHVEDGNIQITGTSPKTKKKFDNYGT